MFCDARKFVLKTRTITKNRYASQVAIFWLLVGGNRMKTLFCIKKLRDFCKVRQKCFQKCTDLLEKMIMSAKILTSESQGCSFSDFYVLLLSC